MKICVLIPNEDALAQAGVRIRYGRIQQILAAQGHELSIQAIDSFATRAQFVHDAYIVSKVYDSRSLVVARLLAGTSILVGADLFDDYFTQLNDTRLVRFQQWMQAFCASANFMLCSTPAMQDVAGQFAPGAPNLVMNDPSPPVTSEAIEAAAVRKLEEARATRTLRIGWFGVGDNPYFDVGLYDLAHFSDALAKLRGRGFDVQLSILTNRRALTPANLAMLARLPVPYDIAEWSEAAERKLIEESLVCFLPVNGQNFSIAKSLNRAVSSLSAGTQVLSPGYPLYRPLGDFVYRNADAFAADLGAGTLAIRPETMPGLMNVLKSWADPDEEATRFISFFERIHPRTPPTPPKEGVPPTAAVIHGQRSSADAHKFAQRLRMLSVSSPFCRLKLNFDARFEFTSEGAVAAYVAEKWTLRLPRRSLSVLSDHGRILDTAYKKVDLEKIPGNPNFAAAGLGRANTLASVTASYPSTMADIEKVLSFVFPGVVSYYSENARLPWRATQQAASVMLERQAS